MRLLQGSEERSSWIRWHPLKNRSQRPAPSLLSSVFQWYHTLWFQGRCWHHPHSLCQSGGLGSHQHWGEMENLLLMTSSSHTVRSEVSAALREAKSPESHRSTVSWWRRRWAEVSGGNWREFCDLQVRPKPWKRTGKNHSEYSDLYYSLFLTAFQSFQAQIEAFLSFSLNSNSSDLFEPLKRVVNDVLSMLALL